MTSTKNVVAGRPKPSGAIFRAPLGTALPTDADSALDGDYIEQGYASDDGLERSISKSFETVNAWGGDEVKRIKTEVGVEITISLIESANGDVAKTIFGENSVVVTPAGSGKGNRVDVTFSDEELPKSVWVFDLKDGDNIRRIVAPLAQVVTEDFTQTYADSDVIAYPVTLALYKDDSGNFFYDYSDDGQTTGSSSSS